VTLFLLGLGTATPAQAALVTTTYCFQQATAFTDSGVGDLLDGTFTRARGHHVQFVRESDDVTVADVFLDDSDGSGGCVTLDGTTGKPRLDDTEEYTIKLPRDAVVSGNTIQVFTATGGTHTVIKKTDFMPTANHTYSYDNGDFWVRLAASDSGHVMAAAQWALQRRPAGMSGETFTFRTGACNGGSGSCFDESSEVMWLADPDFKFLTAKLMGLAISNFVNGHVDPERDDEADLDGCVTGGTANGVLMNSKEYQSEAAYQGFGAFYAASVFNENAGTNPDCEYATVNNVDWDADGVMGETDEDNVFSCHGDSPAPNQSPAPASGVSYFTENCFTNVVQNRGVQFDWLRFLWDYHSDSLHGGHTVSEIFEIWRDANPDAWTETGDTNTSDIPFNRMCDVSGECDGGAHNDFLLLGSNHGVIF
jgi:hypothetical protein